MFHLRNFKLLSMKASWQEELFFVSKIFNEFLIKNSQQILLSCIPPLLVKYEFYKIERYWMKNSHLFSFQEEPITNGDESMQKKFLNSLKKNVLDSHLQIWI